MIIGALSGQLVSAHCGAIQSIAKERHEVPLGGEHGDGDDQSFGEAVDRGRSIDRGYTDLARKRAEPFESPSRKPR